MQAFLTFNIQLYFVCSDVSIFVVCHNHKSFQINFEETYLFKLLSTTSTFYGMTMNDVFLPWQLHFEQVALGHYRKRINVVWGDEYFFLLLWKLYGYDLLRNIWELYKVLGTFSFTTSKQNFISSIRNFI